jgi:hypothetical protein
MFVLRHQVTLTQETLATVWEQENLGELHNTMAGVAYWRDHDGRREALDRAGAELARQGLLAGRDLIGDLRDTLTLLARPSVEYYGWISYTDGEQTTDLSVLVAGVAEEAVLAVREGDRIQLSAARADGLAETLVGLMPQVPAARGRSVNLPEAEISKLGEMREQRGAALPGEAFNVFPRSSMVEDARDLFAVAELPRTGGGELYVAARDRLGERRACTHPLIYIDTQQGRWMTQLSGEKPGDRWIVSAPASRQLLISRLHEMRNSLVG